MREGTGRLDHLVTTHQHWDHYERCEVVAAHRRHGVRPAPTTPTRCPVADVRLDQGDVVRVGELELDVIHLRGHTPGRSRCSGATPAGTPHLFTGDSLFPGGVGNTKNDGQSFESLYADVEERLRPAPTTPGSTPATVTTRRSVPSARTSPSGATAAGEDCSPRLQRAPDRSARLPQPG